MCSAMMPTAKEAPGSADLRPSWSGAGLPVGRDLRKVPSPDRYRILLNGGYALQAPRRTSGRTPPHDDGSPGGHGPAQPWVELDRLLQLRFCSASVAF